MLKLGNIQHSTPNAEVGQLGKSLGSTESLPTGAAPAPHQTQLDRINKMNRMAANPGGEHFIL
jgi:hypothetical protein